MACGGDGPGPGGCDGPGVRSGVGVRRLPGQFLAVAPNTKIATTTAHPRADRRLLIKGRARSISWLFAAGFTGLDSGERLPVSGQQTTKQVRPAVSSLFKLDVLRFEHLPQAGVDAARYVESGVTPTARLAHQPDSGMSCKFILRT